ncbi:hypothetical protein LWI29_005443 [Acer saccharum]|uniref:F-box domain-containing protein n=1 Tax=Acer saccharum TaxID=4024 RepID=A0AA39SMG6_ACESA|nr:hypothetical protein LWI29_005443 [Acer saccharum]
MEVESLVTASLPPELIVDILLRLPVKSLCRFRCVSKSWIALITHSRFVKLHLARSKSQRLIISYGSLYSIDLESLSKNDDNVVALEIDFPKRELNPDPDPLMCICSCNGLLCILNAPNDLLLYNPSTRECKVIPEYASRNIYDPPTLHGFGYAESIDDYKFVKLDQPGNIVEIYSLRKDCWTSVQNDFRFSGNFYKGGFPLNGAIHWVITTFEGSVLIGAFDLVEEKFKILPPPPDITLKNECIYSLGLLRCCLCFLTEKDDRKNQFWVMKEYGVKASWNKMLIANPFSLLEPLCCLNDNETMLLYIDLKQLVFCDPKDGKFKHVEVFGVIDEDVDSEDEWCDVLVCKESLVSPNYRNQCTTEGNP